MNEEDQSDLAAELQRIGDEAYEWGASFPRNLMMGYVFKDLVTVVLDQAGYEVFPYGYESFLPSIKRKFYNKEIRSSPALERIRSTPDLVVYDPGGRTAQLVEVKSRRKKWEGGYEVSIGHYQKYWPESVLVLVVREEPFILAQKVSELSHAESFKLGDMVPLQQAFPRVDWDAKRPFSRSLLTKLVSRLFGAFDGD